MKKESKRTSEQADLEAQVEAQAEVEQNEQEAPRAGKLDKRRSKEWLMTPAGH